MTFAQKIKLERSRLGWSQAEAATYLEQSPKTIWSWENGKEPVMPMQIGVLAMLAKAKVKK